MKDEIISWNEDSLVEVVSELLILVSAVLIAIHINKWGVVSNNFFISIIVIIFFIVIAVGLRSTLKR